MSVEIGVGPAYRSYTSFSSWLSCGKAWQLSRVMEVPERPSWWLAGGKAVHTATEVYDRRMYEATGR